MNNLSTYLKNQLVNAALRGQAYTPPTHIYLALYTSDPTADDLGTEVSGNGYARQQVAYAAPTAGVSVNSTDVTFPQAVGDTPEGCLPPIKGGMLRECESEGLESAPTNA